MSDRMADRRRVAAVTGVFFKVLLGVLVLGLVVGGGAWYESRQEADRDRSAALATAETRAQRFTPKLLSAFASGPRSVDSLRSLGAEVGVDYVTAAMDSGSVVVTWRSTETYDAGWGTTANADVCMRGVISRDRGALVQHASHVLCTEMLPFTVSTELSMA